MLQDFVNFIRKLCCGCGVEEVNDGLVETARHECMMYFLCFSVLVVVTTILAGKKTTHGVIQVE